MNGDSNLYVRELGIFMCSSTISLRMDKPYAISFCFDLHYSPSAALVDASDMDSRHPEAAQCQAT